jgi:undecaprenyl-diphosphatase
MSIFKVMILAIVQGLAELLPVSSSAHVVVAEKLLGLDPSSPEMTMLLVMLHTGTMFAVIVYFWRQWRDTYFQSLAAFKPFSVRVIVATLLTGIVGETIIKFIEHTFLQNVSHAEIEDLFSHLEFVAPALAVAGVLITSAGLMNRAPDKIVVTRASDLTLSKAGVIGMVQGLCLPFRGLSRSGATISAGMLLSVGKSQAEAFSFALAVVITPPVVLREVLRLVKPFRGAADERLSSVILLSLFGSLVAFISGLVALRWLSKWLESGKWYLFGIYCLVASAAVYGLYVEGY